MRQVLGVSLLLLSVRVLQRSRTSRIYIDTHEEIYYRD